MWFEDLRKRSLNLTAAHCASMLTEWQDCTEVKPQIEQRGAEESWDQNIVWIT